MKLSSLLTAAALACAVAGSGTAQAETLRWAAQNDILTLDPHSQNHATTNAILMHSYEGLTRYNDKFEVELVRLLFESVCMPAQVVGCGVQLVLVGGQCRTTQVGPSPGPRVDVAMSIEAHHRRGFDGLGETAQIVRPLSELVCSGDRVHHTAVGASIVKAERSEVGELHGAVGDYRRLIWIVGDEECCRVGFAQQRGEFDLLHDRSWRDGNVARCGAGQTRNPEHEARGRAAEHPECEPCGDRTIHARAAGRFLGGAGVGVALHRLHPFNGESPTKSSATARMLIFPGESHAGVT